MLHAYWDFFAYQQVKLFQIPTKKPRRAATSSSVLWLPLISSVSSQTKTIEKGKWIMRMVRSAVLKRSKILLHGACREMFFSSLRFAGSMTTFQLFGNTSVILFSLKLKKDYYFLNLVKTINKTISTRSSHYTNSIAVVRGRFKK